MAGTITVKVPGHTRRGKKVKGFTYTRKAGRKSGARKAGRKRGSGPRSLLGSKKHLAYLKGQKNKGSKKRRAAIARSQRRYQRVARKRRASRAA